MCTAQPHSSTTVGEDELVGAFNNLSSAVYTLNPFPHQIVNGDYPIPKSGVWENENVIIAINAEETPLSVGIIPYSTTAESSIIKVSIGKKIDKQLEKLAKAMAEWLSTNNQTLKGTYVQDIISCNKYLTEHYSDMNEKQKQFYQKLKSVEVQ